MTEELFREDAYLKSCSATVTKVDERGVQLYQTVFYPVGGGQPGDTGVLSLADGSKLTIIGTFKDRDTGEHILALEEGAAAPAVGSICSRRNSTAAGGRVHAVGLQRQSAFDTRAPLVRQQGDIHQDP